MPDEQKLPGSGPGLSKKFKEFAFGDAPNAPVTEVSRGKAPQAPLPPVSSEPVQLTKEDLDFMPYRGMHQSQSGRGRDIVEEERIEKEEEAAWEQHDWEVQQEQTFTAAGMMFRREREITNILTMLSNLEMQSVVAAGILLEQYADLPKRRRDDMVIAALALNAANFDDICGEMTPETVGMVDEIHRMAAEPDREARRLHAEGLEPDSKRVMLANVVADLEMALHEMSATGGEGPPKEHQAHVAEFIESLAPGVDRSLRQRAITAFNVISAATDNGATFKETPDGGLVLKAQPDIFVPIEDAAPRAKKPSPGKAQKPRKPGGKT